MTKLSLGILVTVFCVYLGVWIYVTTNPFRVAPPTYTYTILGKNFFYPSMILQGRDGAWSVIDTHTTRPMQPVFIHTYFILLGKIAKIFAIDPVTMYQLVRVVSGVVFFAAVLRLIMLLVPKGYRLFTLLFALGVETGPLTRWQPSFDNQVTYERFFGLPHHVTGEALGLLLLGELVLAVRHPSSERMWRIALLTLATTLTLPPYVPLLGLTVMAVWFIWAIQKGEVKTLMPSFFLVGSITLAVTIFMQMEFARGLPWTVSAVAEKSWWDTKTLLTQYSSSLLLFMPFIGILWWFAVTGWKKLSQEIRWLTLTMSAWVVFPFFLIPIAKTSWFPIANFRLVDATQYVPAGILAGLGLGLVHKPVRAILAVVLLIGSSWLTTIYTKQTLERQSILWSNVYPLTSTWEAVTSLQRYVEKGSGVMVREYFGEILPAFANIRVFIGGPHGWPDWPERQAISMQFFSGRMSDPDALSLLRRENISYVFYGPDEKAVNQTGSLYPTILTPVYSTDSVTVYRVQK